MDEIPDIPLDNFGAETEVAASPVASEVETPSEQTTQPAETSGSEAQEAQPVTDNSIVEPTESGRPEKQDRLQSRFGELTSKIRERDVELEKLQAQIAQMQATGEVKPLQPDENGQFSVEEIQRNQRETAQAIAQAQVSQLESRLERETIANRYDQEGTQIETKWAEDFKANPVHLEIIQEQIAETVALNSGNQQALKQISPYKIAERYMKGVESERRRAQSVTAQNLQTTQANSAVVPEGSATGEDPDSDSALEARVSSLKF